MKEAIKILVVEDEPLVAEDLAAQVEDMGFEVAGICYSGADAITKIDEGNVDAALLDIRLEDNITGIDVAKHIRSTANIPFLYVTSHSDRSTLDEAKVTQPSGYIVKPFDENDLFAALEIAIFNYFNQQPKKLTLESVNAQLPTPLSEREFEVLNLLKEGKTNKEIGESIFLSVNTVKTHLLKVYEKLDAKNRTEALFRLNQLI
ncbi:MAG: response regulator transcription factor [Flavobacteriales bacterium]|nr:response regulator transcription factor [Flavobacteriales bacterium]